MAEARPHQEQGQRAPRQEEGQPPAHQERVEYVDWKDVNLLRRFMSDRAKIRARRVTGNSTQQQAEIARAIKNAREMALLPYASRVTQTAWPASATASGAAAATAATCRRPTPSR